MSACEPTVEVSPTTEKDIINLPPECAFKFKCVACDRLSQRIMVSLYTRVDGVRAKEGGNNQDEMELWLIE